jgi:signal transduction histidine kinase
MELTLHKCDLDHLYPFFLGITPDWKVSSFGRSAEKCFLNISVDTNAREVFKIISPKNLVETHDLNKVTGKVVTIKSLTTSIEFNGEVLWIEADKVFMFATTPVIQDVDSLTKFNLSYSDFSAYSPVFDFFILIQAERFARKEQSKAFTALEQQIAFAKLNLDIANFCSRCFEINDALKFSLSSIEDFLSLKGQFHPASQSSPLVDTTFENKLIRIPLRVNEETRFILDFESETTITISESLKIFFSSLRFTLENFITKIDQYNFLQEAQASKVVSSRLYTLGEMAAGIAHELNNPLAIIQGHAWVTLTQIQNKEELSIPKLEESMNKIIKMTERSGKIIKGLRVFARDATEDPMEKIDLSAVIEETLELCKSRLTHRGITLYWEPVGPNMSLGRSIQISQVLLNMLNNAADAIENSKDPWIRISVEPRDNFWHVLVTDSGNGIPIEIQEKIMSPFFTTKAPGKGTGLGLSISNSILKHHNGDFWYEKNSPNTCFCFKLPIFKD